MRWGALAICASVLAIAPIASVQAAESSAAVAPRAPVNLRSAANYAILAKAGISTTGKTAIYGNIGVSPIADTAITGFSLILDGSNRFSMSNQVLGKVFAASYATPTPTRLTKAVGDMLSAYNNAAGRKNPRANELGGGNIGGLVIKPGLYKWSSNVMIPANVTLSGPKDSVWIFQVAGSLNVGAGKKVLLALGARDENIFWQVAGGVTLETTAVLRGTLLSKTAIVMKTGARLNGRALSQTAVTLDSNAVTRP